MTVLPGAATGRGAAKTGAGAARGAKAEQLLYLIHTCVLPGTGAARGKAGAAKTGAATAGGAGIAPGATP